MPTRITRNEKLGLRLTFNAKRALQAAAAASHRSVSEFLLESALARADAALADRGTFGLNATQWTAFVAALDAPVGLVGDSVIGYHTLAVSHVNQESAPSV